MSDTDSLPVDTSPDTPGSPLGGATSTVVNSRSVSPQPAESDADVHRYDERGIRRTVPYGALAEERARRKELQRELQDSIETQQRLQGRLDVLHELAHQNGKQSTEQDQSSTAVPPDATEAGRDEELPSQTDVAFRTQLMNSVRDAMRERPDFVAAYQHARQARVSELVALGYAPAEALGITFDNELEIIRNAYANGTNPAQVIYDYARRRGYRGGEQRDMRSGAAASSTHSAMPSEAEKVALAARGQAASKSLSTAGGGSTGSLTLETLAGMSDEEFAEATKGERWQKLLK